MQANFRLLTATLALALSNVLPAVAAIPSVPEPGTTFYGRVYNVRNGHEEIKSSGQLTWTFSTGTGTTTLNTSIEIALGVGRYRMEVPHSLLADGLAIQAGSLPLGVMDSELRVLSIAIDGHPATIRAPGKSLLTLNALQRASAIRLDLAISHDFLDSDGDGMPDWWEDKHGLDKTLNDALADLDLDGVSNLNEFLQSTRPEIVNTSPQLRTGELTMMADGSSAVLLDTHDADSAPSQLVYTLTAEPASPGLKLRSSGQPTALHQGSTFTQADVNAGRIVFEHAVGASPEPVALAVSVSDGTAGHPPATGTVTLRFFRPELEGETAGLAALAAQGAAIPEVPATDLARTRLYLLARENQALAWDVSLRLTPSALESSVSAAYLGGNGDDAFTGSAVADLITGGPGDDQLTGSEGADHFFITSAADGNDTILDFDITEGDVLHLEGLLDGTSTDVRSYVRLTSDSSGSTVGLDFDGVGSTYSDMTVRLAGLTGSDANLFSLFHRGHLVVPGLILPPAVSVVASNPVTSENGPPAGAFTITRLGSLDQDLLVPATLSGSATNGSDYELITSPIVIPAGKESLEVKVTAMADSIVEPNEIAQITLQPDAAFVLSGSASAQVLIGDLMPEISVELLEPVAVLDTGAPAIIAVNRTGLTGQSLVVRFDVAGSATPGLDYTRLPSYVLFQPYQTTSLLSVKPLATANLNHGVETVGLSLRSDAAYRLTSATRAVARIVTGETWVETWKAQHFAGDSTPMSSFLVQDSGNRGINNLLAYAFKTDPRTPDPANLPKMRRNGGHLHIDFIRDFAARDLRYVVEFSTDLRSWSSDPDLVEDVTPDAPADGRWANWRARRSMADDTTQYLRVRVEQAN